MISVEHKAFAAHPNVLAAASPFMRVHLKQQGFADSGTRELVIYLQGQGDAQGRHSIAERA